MKYVEFVFLILTVLIGGVIIMKNILTNPNKQKALHLVSFRKKRKILHRIDQTWHEDVTSQADALDSFLKNWNWRDFFRSLRFSELFSESFTQQPLKRYQQKYDWIWVSQNWVCTFLAKLECYGTSLWFLYRGSFLF